MVICSASNTMANTALRLYRSSSYLLTMTIRSSSVESGVHSSEYAASSSSSNGDDVELRSWNSARSIVVVVVVVVDEGPPPAGATLPRISLSFSSRERERACAPAAVAATGFVSFFILPGRSTFFCWFFMCLLFLSLFFFPSLSVCFFLNPR